MQLEDANDLEIRQLKEGKSALTSENKTLTAKVHHQGDQSMFPIEVRVRAYV